jgi:antitoxin component YwqK of YwqJK toxin-antitoxin module
MAAATIPNSIPMKALKFIIMHTDCHKYILALLLLSGCKTKIVFLNGGSEIREYSPNGELRSIELISNGFDSTITSYYKGKVSSIVSFHKGKNTGTSSFFYSNGQKNFEQSYDSLGRSDGRFCLWYDNGKKEENYRSDSLMSAKTFSK